jgi:hypothetical protein
MKPLLKMLISLFLMLSSVSVAHAVVCASGVYRAGCAGPNGVVAGRRSVVVAPRPIVVAPRRSVAVAPAPRHCRWRNGVRICR